MRIEMVRTIKYFLIFALMITFSNIAYAQIQDPLGNAFRENQALVRIAEPGQLADTVNLWGDINAPGRYLIPRGTTVPELISYGKGFSSNRSGNTRMGWSRLRVLVTISQYNRSTDSDHTRLFQFKSTDPLPQGIRSYHLKNNEVVSLEVRRKPAFADYVGVVAPLVSIILTSVVIANQVK